MCLWRTAEIVAADGVLRVMSLAERSLPRRPAEASAIYLGQLSTARLSTTRPHRRLRPLPPLVAVLGQASSNLTADAKKGEAATSG